MARKKIETKIEEIVEDIKEEATEEVGTVTFKRWQIVLAAAAITLLVFVVFF